MAVTDLGDALRSVWAQAQENHNTYSATGSDESDVRFFALALCGEAGEAANFVKKRWRDGQPYVDEIRFEAADVCAYAFILAWKMGLGPDELIALIAEKQQMFVAKMKRR